MFTSGPAYGEAIGTFQDEPLYHASLDPSEYRALLAEQGFAVVAHKAEDPSAAVTRSGSRNYDRSAITLPCRDRKPMFAYRAQP
jgi:hypothetical protein